MQLNYAINQSAAFAGMLYDIGNNDYVSSRNPSVAVPFGLAQVQNTADTDCKFPASSGDLAKMLGVSIAVQHKMNPLPGINTVVGYLPGDEIGLIRKGRIWVAVEEAVNAMDPAFVRFAAGTFTQLGAFRKSADSASAAAVPGMMFRTSAQAGGFAVLEINLPA